MVTIQDIADRVGVAKSTVSRYLNGGSVSKKTREKIRAVIAETGFEPNVFAKSLKAGKTNLIGVVIPRLDSSATATVLKSIDKMARDHKQQILIVNTDQQIERELEAIKTLARQKVDQIILIATHLKDAHYELIASIETPLLIVGQESDQLATVAYDDYGAGQLIGQYVARKGHFHKVLYLGVSESDKAVGFYRKQGVLAGLAENPRISLSVMETSFHLLDAYAIGLKLFKEGKSDYDYIVAATDNIALGILKAAHEAGVRVPEDLAVSGFGGYDSTFAVHPPLTTVAYPYSQVGEAIWAQFKNKEKRTSILPVQLIERQSTNRK